MVCYVLCERRAENVLSPKPRSQTRVELLLRARRRAAEVLEEKNCLNCSPLLADDTGPSRVRKEATLKRKDLA